MSSTLEERAKHFFATGKYSVREAYEQARKELNLEKDLPEGVADLFSVLKGAK